jgi:hypothetical protein
VRARKISRKMFAGFVAKYLYTFGRNGWFGAGSNVAALHSQPGAFLQQQQQQQALLL